MIYSIVIFYKYGDSFYDCLIFALNSGGDTESIGAITGALAGSFYGLKKIPEKWIKGLANNNQIRLRGEALAGENVSGLKDLYEMERQLTAKESEERVSISRKSGVTAKKREKNETKIDIPPGFIAPSEVKSDDVSILKQDKVKWRKYLKQKSKDKKMRRGMNKR